MDRAENLLEQRRGTCVLLISMPECLDEQLQHCVSWPESMDACTYDTLIHFSIQLRTMPSSYVSLQRVSAQNRGTRSCQMCQIENSESLNATVRSTAERRVRQ